MKIETQGWGNSMVATKYIYQRIHGILDGQVMDMPHELSRFMDEMAHNYTVDTGKKIGEDL